MKWVALVAKSDISIAHRLPGRNSNARPLIVRFGRRVSKVDFLRTKRNLNQSQSMRSVKVFEDLTALRRDDVMKQDGRFESIWTREGSIFSNSKLTIQRIVAEDSMKEERSCNTQ